MRPNPIKLDCVGQWLVKERYIEKDAPSNWGISGQSSNKIWGNSTCILGKQLMETLAQLHMNLIHVLRINDVDGYINILPAIIKIFAKLCVLGILFLNQLARQSHRVKRCSRQGPFP